MGKRKDAWKKGLAGAIALIVLAVMAVCFILLPSSDKMASGLHIGSVDIGNMTKDDAKARLTEVSKVVQTNGVVLDLMENETKSWPVRANEIDFAIDVDATVDRAYEVGRSGNLWENLVAGYEARTRSDMVS